MPVFCCCFFFYIYIVQIYGYNRCIVVDFRANEHHWYGDNECDGLDRQESKGPDRWEGEV